MKQVECSKCGNSTEFAEVALQEEFDIYIWDVEREHYVFSKTQKGENHSTEIVCNKCETIMAFNWPDFGAYPLPK